ncbi:multicopper oxidase family protein [Lentzea sp. NBRC 105346]|uniref:multicopper oxidase family protein n=1 Tax=Lentzea sp. NBRC 105346 TaxID=3032205 RepID=UPI00255676D1|nr:multicopper oxidase family protein [Lentzea sp. NBRC 105346]
MTLSRRGFLGALGISALGVSSFGGALLPAGQTAQLLRSRARLPEPFTVPLTIPPPARQIATDHYEIVQRAESLEILPGLRTPVLTYDGHFPGPTVVSRRGRAITVTHRNELDVPTVVHLHGGHTPAESDGFPTDLLMPVSGAHQGHAMHGGGIIAHGTRDYVYPCDQPAATLWYHDHRMDFTGPQVYRGLAGFHLVHDDEEDALPLPKGERDLPLMITDRAFAEDGSLLYPSRGPEVPGVTEEYMEGVLGDVILVNGRPWPVLEVDAARYRLRLLNASNARRYRLTGLPFTQIGSDGGLLEHPVSLNEVLIAPGERVDVVADFSGLAAGTEVIVHNGLGSGTTAQVMKFRVTRRVQDDSRVPDVLTRFERLDPAKAVRTRDWRFGRGKHGGGDNHGWLVNDRPFDPYRADATVRLGEVEIWRFSTDLHHPVHVHLNPFQVVSSSRSEPPVGWKDTVNLGPAEHVEVAVRFTDHAGRFLVHCHNLEHEDMAMMASYDTV